MTGWSNDPVPFPGAAARQTMEMLVRDNGFMCDGVRLAGDPVGLRDSRDVLLGVVAERDHVVPEPIACAGARRRSAGSVQDDFPAA